MFASFVICLLLKFFSEPSFDQYFIKVQWLVCRIKSLSWRTLLTTLPQPKKSLTAQLNCSIYTYLYFGNLYKLDQGTWLSWTHLDIFCTIMNQIIPYWIILDHIGPFWTIVDHLSPFTPFWTISDNFGPGIKAKKFKLS